MRRTLGANGLDEQRSRFSTGRNSIGNSQPIQDRRASFSHPPASRNDSRLSISRRLSNVQGVLPLPPTSQSIKDPRNLRDKKKAYASHIISVLSNLNYPHQISMKNMMNSPSVLEVKNMFVFLHDCLFAYSELDFKLLTEEYVLSCLRAWGYPYTNDVKPKFLASISITNWIPLLGALAWMAELVKIADQINQTVSLENIMSTESDYCAVAFREFAQGSFRLNAKNESDKHLEEEFKNKLAIRSSATKEENKQIQEQNVLFQRLLEKFEREGRPLQQETARRQALQNDIQNLSSQQSIYVHKISQQKQNIDKLQQAKVNAENELARLRAKSSELVTRIKNQEMSVEEFEHLNNTKDMYRQTLSEKLANMEFAAREASICKNDFSKTQHIMDGKLEKFNKLIDRLNASTSLGLGHIEMQQGQEEMSQVQIKRPKIMLKDTCLKLEESSKKRQAELKQANEQLEMANQEVFQRQVQIQDLLEKIKSTNNQYQKEKKLFLIPSMGEDSVEKMTNDLDSMEREAQESLSAATNAFSMAKLAETRADLQFNHEMETAVKQVLETIESLVVHKDTIRSKLNNLKGTAQKLQC